jgi:ABC-type multidrug transport system ATPase subunit
MLGSIIGAEGLVTRVGKVVAIAELELVSRRGEVTAVVGLNGVGKTTSVGTIATLVRHDRGGLRMAGIERVRRIIRQHDSASTFH